MLGIIWVYFNGFTSRNSKNNNKTQTKNQQSHRDGHQFLIF